MITSTLQSNALFDPTSISGRGYLGRTTGNRSYGTNDQSYSTSGFGQNIWQSNWLPNADKMTDHVVKPNGSRRPQLPSLALPNIKASAHFFGSNTDRKSPIGSERSTIRDSEPHSARSRSQHESNTLTPTSLSNDSEGSMPTGISSQDQKRQVGSGNNYSEGRRRPSIWPNAPEFQPSLTTQHPNSLYTDSYEESRNVFGTALKTLSLNAPEYAHASIWHSSNKDNQSFERSSEFRPLLPPGINAGSSSDYERNLRATKNDLQDLSMNFDRLAVEAQRRRNDYSFSGMQTSVAGKSQALQQNVQDRPRQSRYFSDTWVERPYAQKYNQQIPGSSVPRSGIGFSQLPVTNGIEISSSIGTSILHDSSQSSSSNIPSQASDTRSRFQINEFRPSDLRPRSSQAYEYGIYGTEPTSDGWVEYRTLNYDTTPAIGDRYMFYDPATRPQPELAQIARSPLLEEFRIHGKTKKYELKDIFGHIVEFSGDQLGSRFIQHKLEVANSEEKDRVFSEIACDSRQLMTDLFGNYVIQKLFEHGNQSQKKVLASHMKGHVIALSTQQFGCRVVQKALEHVLTDQQASLIKELDGYVLKVVDNQHGNHVIQKAIECVSGEHIQFIVDAHRGHIHALSKHAYGCRVIQRMLEHCQPRAKRAVLDELHMNIGDLIQDPFGNYVVQHVIVNGEAQDRKPVIDKVQSKLLENAMHKFASNVVEKALDYAEEDQRQAMLRTLTSRDEDGHSQILKLLGHQYGNYVIQKSAAHMNGHALHALLEEMEQYLMQLRRVSTGKQISALESSVRDARQRLFTQRHQNMILNAPTEPSRHTMVRRGT